MKPHDPRFFSAHEVWTEEPDILCVRFVGEVRGQDLRRMVDYRNAWCVDRSWFFLLADMTATQGVDSEARRVMVEERAAVDRRQISLYFGAGFAIRVIAQMMFRSLRVLRPAVEHAERIFVATEAEARAFIEQRRSQLVAMAGGRT